MADTPRRPVRTRPAAANTPGGRLAALRKARKMSQLALSDRIGVGDRSMISKYEKGQHKIPDEVLQRAADVFDIPVGRLRYGRSEERMIPVTGLVGAGGLVEAVETWRGEVEVPSSWTDAQKPPRRSGSRPARPGRSRPVHNSRSRHPGR